MIGIRILLNQGQLFIRRFSYAVQETRTPDQLRKVNIYLYSLGGHIIDSIMCNLRPIISTVWVCCSILYGGCSFTQTVLPRATLLMQCLGLIQTLTGDHIQTVVYCQLLASIGQLNSLWLCIFRQPFSHLTPAAARTPEGCLESSVGPIPHPGSIFPWLTKAQPQH